MCVRRAHTMYKNYTLTFETSHSWKNQELHRQHRRMDTRISQYDTASHSLKFNLLRQGLHL